MKASRSSFASKLWLILTDLSKINSPDAEIKRKGQLLALYFLLIFTILIYTTINNGVYLIFHSGMEYTIYLMEDILLLLLFWYFWKMNKKGHVLPIAYTSITLTILLAMVSSDPGYLEYSMVIFALPIGMSSFIIRPYISFVYALLTTLAYIATSILYGYIWEYNLTSTLALFSLAFMTWVIARQLEDTLKANDKLIGDVQTTYNELRNAYETTLEGWSRALEIRDRETQGHSKRVTELTLRVARRMGISEEQIVHIYRGVLLHDIGKIGIPDDILRKPGPLTEQETRIMRLHPQISVDLLSPIDYLRPAMNIPRYHHEKWDGTGYPHGLIGEAIPLEARIFAIVDVYDALMHDRPYRKGWAKQKVLELIRSESGKHFDPEIVEIFLHEISNDKD